MYNFKMRTATFIIFLVLTVSILSGCGSTSNNGALNGGGNGIIDNNSKDSVSDDETDSKTNTGNSNGGGNGIINDNSKDSVSDAETDNKANTGNSNGGGDGIINDNSKDSVSDTETDNKADTGNSNGEADLSAVPENLRNNILLNAKERGSCKKLKGKVVITVVTVNEPGSVWTAQSIQSLKSKHSDAASLMINEAYGHGIGLQLVFNYVSSTVDLALTMQNYSLWAPQVMKNAGLESLETFGIEQAKRNSCDSAPVFFCVNRPGRSFAITGQNTEYGCFYEGAEDFRHELNHMFGAVDYYFPDSLKAIAKRYYPDSIMLGEKTPYVTDSFNAYLIGWKDTLSVDDLAFLTEVSLIPTTDFTNPEVSNTHTGYIENYKYADAWYTGDLIDGVPYGKGKIVYADGGWYDGDFVYGNFEGKGKLVYADGGWYEGYFTDGRFEGKGKLVYADGSWYDGDFVHGNFEGKGKRVFADGSWYEGYFTNGSFAGKGKLVYADGACYEGDFAGGHFHGQGTFYWKTGERFTGTWSNGVQNGYGTYYYADGTSFSGYWNNGNYTG